MVRASSLGQSYSPAGDRHFENSKTRISFRPEKYSSYRYKLRIRWPGFYSSEAFWQSRGSFSHYILIVVKVGAETKTTLKPTVK
jgi:hypothetical protein